MLTTNITIVKCSALSALRPALMPRSDIPPSYPVERARSRSPVSRSLSPRSHSPSFTSCSSTHSPPGAACRGDWNSSLGPRRGSWDWSSQATREDEREEACWRNGDDDRPNGRMCDRRKPYLKLTDRMSPRSAEEWADGLRGVRDRYPRGSPQSLPFSLHRSKEEDFYKKEFAYKPDKLQRVPYQRHEAKSKRKDPSEHYRSRHAEAELLEDPPAPRIPEDRKPASPAKGNSKKAHRRQEVRGDDKEAESQVHTWTLLQCIICIILMYNAVSSALCIIQTMIVNTKWKQKYNMHNTNEHVCLTVVLCPEWYRAADVHIK